VLGSKRNSRPSTIRDRGRQGAVNAALRQNLLRHDEGWLTEESADDLSRLDKQRVSVVDPLDGTREFVMGLCSAERHGERCACTAAFWTQRAIVIIQDAYVGKEAGGAGRVAAGMDSHRVVPANQSYPGIIRRAHRHDKEMSTHVFA